MRDGYTTILAIEPAAAPKGKAQPFLSIEFWLAVGLLMAVLLIGAVVLSFMDRWRKRQMLAGQDPAEALTSFRELYEQGELSEEEYQRVRNRVAAKMKETIALPPVEVEPKTEKPLSEPLDGKPT